MESTTGALAQRIRARGLPEAVVTIALRGGSVAHPALEFHAEHIEMTGDDPTSAVISFSGRDDLVPLWMTGSTETVFSAADGTVELWSAEDETGPWYSWPDFAAAVRHLLTDLDEFMVSEQDRHEIAALLLPADQIAAALMPEER